MSEKKFDVYLEFNYTHLNICVLDLLDNHIIYKKNQFYKSYIDSKELNFDELYKLVEDNIFEVEKSTNEFIKDIYLMIETPLSKNINLSVMKKNEDNKIFTSDVMYLIQDAKQQILSTNLNLEIIHIVIDNYILDNVIYKYLPLDINCKNFSLDLQFICFPKNLIKDFEELFLKQQILINRFICSNYVRKFNFENRDLDICQKGREIEKGINKQEVVSVPKIIKKTGFFERLFHFFS